MTMRLTRRKHLGRYCSRCLLTGLAIVAYLTSTIGFPLPVSRAREQSPSSDCQGHQCGCPESDCSQQKCCCFPHGNKVDSTAVQEKPEIACSSCERSATRQPICAHQNGKHQSNVRWLLGVNALRCHGLSTLWIAAGA